MPELRIDRLALQLSGVSEWEGRRIAEMIAEGMRVAAPPQGGRRVDRLGLDLTGRPGEGLEELSGRIVRALLAQLERT